jgi:hypothetical protein
MVDESTLVKALTAYNAVWDSYTPLDAKTAGQCRREALLAAFEAVGYEGPEKIKLTSPRRHITQPRSAPVWLEAGAE